MAKALESAFVLAVLTLMFGICLFPSCDSARHDLVTLVPLGSKLSELDRYLDRAPTSTGEVDGYIASKEAGAEPTPVSEDYDGWGVTPEQKDRFTGTITFYHHGSTSDDVNELRYRNGKLVFKDWGFLPG